MKHTPEMRSDKLADECSRLREVNEKLLAALIVLRERHMIDDSHHAHLCEYCKHADAAISKATQP